MTNTINVISIDPGNNLGIVIYTLDAVTLKVVNIDTMLLVLNNYVDDLAGQDKLLSKLMLIDNMCSYISKAYRPHVIIEEAAFLNVRFPKAVMQLSQYIAAIEMSFKRNNSMIKIFRYPPKYIKKRVTDTGNADKDAMLVGVLKIPEITNFINPKHVSEHEVDALAIGITGIEELRKYPHVLYSY